MRDINMTFGQWVRIAPFAGYKIGRYTRPKFVGGRETPETLDGLTMGQLMELTTLPDKNESIYTVTRVVVGLTEGQTDRARAVDVVRLVGWVASEAERINGMFSKAEAKPTKQEEKAGIRGLRFGLFGMVDWYARRMGITNHDEVMAVPWLRVWRCMDMDNRTNAFARRLQEVVNEEYKERNRMRR